MLTLTAKSVKLRQATRKRHLAQNKKSPGQVGDKLRRKMGDALADIFSESGTKLYADAVLKMKDGMESILKDGISGLESTIKTELGNRGLSHASTLFRPWISELVEEIVHFGMEEISGGLEDLASDAAAEFSTKPEDEDSAEADLLGMGDEEEPLGEVDTVEEEPVAEPTPEGEAAVPGVSPEGGEVATGFEIPGGEAGASMRNDPYAPRTWRQRGRARIAKTTLELTPQHLVGWLGGLDELQRKAKTARAALKLLQIVQTKAIPRLVQRSAAVAVREVDPLTLLDYVHRFFPYRG